VNNVSKIEGIRHCESLAKLDLTLNFIDVEDLEESVDNLAECEEMSDLYLTGNPCTQWEGYKQYIIARVSQLKRLDGEEITKSQRLEARQRLKELQAMLKVAVEESLEKKRTMDPEEYKQSYTKESRVEAYEQLQRQKEESEAKSKENSMFSDFREFDESFKKKPIPSVYTPQGDIRQCNEGRYEFQFSESDDGTCILFELKLPRFMDTSLVNVDLHPLYVRLDIKGKITQLKF
jgi:protein TilB